MTTLEQILIIIVFVMIAQWSTFFIMDMFFGGCTFRDWKDYIIKNGVISLGLIVCIIIAWINSVVI